MTMKTQENDTERILRTKEICQRLGISRRTFGRRLASGWKQGYWFFKEGREWCINQKNLTRLITALANKEFDEATN